MKKNGMSFFVMAAIGLALVGCKSVRTPGGTIPDGYAQAAKQFEGVYTGAFNGQKGELTIRVDGNHPVVTFHGERFDDLIGPNCGSAIGDLSTIEIADQDNALRVRAVNFKFDANLCTEVQGRMLTLYFREKAGQMVLTASILKDLYSNDCFPGTIGSIHSPMDPIHRCTTDDRAEYLTGKFVRN